MRLIDADDFFNRMNNDTDLCAEMEFEGLKALKKYLDLQPTAYSVDKVIEELEKELEKGNMAIDFGEFRLFEIVKQGGVADDVCEWKLEDEEANLYLTGCQQRQLIFEGTPKENGYRYCPYCSKKIKVVE